MSTGIEWTDETWNPLAAFDEDGERGWFCTKVSPGCANCYAEGMNKRFGTGHGYRVPNLEEIEFRLVNLGRPLKWEDSNAHDRVFVNSMTDLFHEEVESEMIWAIFGIMAACPDTVFQVLTKRPARMREFLGVTFGEAKSKMRGALFRQQRDYPFVFDVTPDRWPPANVWLGTSVEDQKRANERIPDLVAIPNALKFISCEPLLGSIELDLHRMDEIDWIIVGGESGPGARSMAVEWARNIVVQCREADVPAFVKQLGAKPRYLPDRPGGTGGYLPIEDSKGGDPSEWPEDLRVREFPDEVKMAAMARDAARDGD